MYYILTYDISSPKRLPKALKICRRYLFWIQNSVFEGELTLKQFENLIAELSGVINKKEDSVVWYFTRTKELMIKETLGSDKNEITFTF